MTIYRIDGNRGNDSNDGINAPWQNPTKIATVAANPGDQFLIEAESVFNIDLATRIVPGTNWTGTEGNPVRIGKYNFSSQASPDQLPLFRWNRKILASEWVYDSPNNAWVYTAPHTVGALCHVRLAGAWGASRLDSGMPLASVAGRYHNSGNNFYLWAPQGINPTAYYGEVLLSTNAGLFTFSNSRGFNIIEDLAFEETSTGILGYSDAGTAVGVIAQRIRGRGVSALIRFGTGGTTGQLYAEARYNDIKDWGPAAIQGYSAAGEGFKRYLIHHNRIDDGMFNYSQGAIYSQVRSTGLKGQIFQNHITRARWASRDKLNDGCAIYAETGTDNLDVWGNLIEDCYCALQDNSGRTTRWYSNFIRRCWSAMQCGDAENNNAGNHNFFNNTCEVGNKVLTPEFGSGRTSTGWRCLDDNSSPMVINIRNNLLYDRSGISPRAAVITPQIAWSGQIANNAIVGWDVLAEKEFTGGAGGVPNPVNTITTGLSLSLDGYKPAPGSPLLNGGADLGWVRDFDGKQGRKYIGAFAGARLRKAL